ncbi:hypothetical protein LZ31DRAFT_127955 [Colletotrichum somersetense]|nr:hypothetical protein LZ31DRAFT_127955 [Colletotrichum somersetense]
MAQPPKCAFDVSLGRSNEETVGHFLIRAVSVGGVFIKRLVLIYQHSKRLLQPLHSVVEGSDGWDWCGGSACATGAVWETTRSREIGDATLGGRFHELRRIGKRYDWRNEQQSWFLGVCNNIFFAVERKSGIRFRKNPIVIYGFLCCLSPMCLGFTFSTYLDEHCHLRGALDHPQHNCKLRKQMNGLHPQNHGWRRPFFTCHCGKFGTLGFDAFNNISCFPPPLECLSRRKTRCCYTRR